MLDEVDREMIARGDRIGADLVRRLVASHDTLESAILTIIKSMNEYLPPTGGDKDKFISEVIGAVDNADIAAALKAGIDHAE